MDWGLARLLRTGPAFQKPARDDRPGLVGTLEYMSPEQAWGNPDEIADRRGGAWARHLEADPRHR